MNFKLFLAYTIHGIGAASGLVYINNSLYLIADNSSYLYNYDIDAANLNRINLFKESQENIKKKLKPDLEAIALKENKLHIIGSGSTEKRNTKFIYNLDTKTVKQKNLAKKYQKFKEFASISDDDLNIEGVICHNDAWYFFQRGNSENAKNGVFIIDKNKNIDFKKIDLPSVNGIEATFTDAILVGDKIYFLAAVEDTNSTYNDGEILGSFIGGMTLNFELTFTKKISDVNKFEGLTIYNQNATETTFLLCEDNDKEEMVSNIYKLVLTND